MSRGYRITVPSSVSTSTVVASDELCIAVSLLPVLAPERLQELLKQALRDDGWHDEAGTLVVDLGGGLEASLNDDGRGITVTRTTSRELRAVAHTQQEADRAVRAQLDKAEHDLRRVATTSLASAEGDVRARLEGVIQKVYGTALEEKARSLGQLESMQRTVGADGTVELVLKIRT